MGSVILFPGVNPFMIRPRPKSIAELPEGAKALVVIAERGRFVVTMEPARSASERKVRQSFSTASEAMRFARQTAIACPRLYQLIIDQTGSRQTVGEILGLDPQDFDGAA